MTKESSKNAQGGAHATRRAPYATKACDVCRRKKIKCNEVKPVCGACAASKRHEECSWSGENVRVPRTEQHFEALRKRVNALEEYANMLESMLDQCRQQHGGVDESAMSFRKLRPSSATEDHYDPQFVDVDDEGHPSPTEELTLATMNLKMEDRDLVLYSSVAPFRFEKYDSQSSRIPHIIDDPNAHYVLQIEGIDDSYCDPTLEWSRYLPPSTILTRREHDKLLDLLFKFFTSWCLRVVPALFLRDMYRALASPASQPPPKTSHYSPMLHNALIALATAFSDDPQISDFDNRNRYALLAKNYIEEECQKPNICVVQALSLLGSFHSSRGDQNLGYLYFGMSIRIGQILGLNVDCSKWVDSGQITYDDMLDRNWAHWTLFSLDVCWSLYIGRDCSVPVPSEGKMIPVPFVDSVFDQIPWHYHRADVAPQPNYLSRVFAATCELCLVVRKVMEIINALDSSNSRYAVTDEIVSKLDLQLNTWKGSLSPEVDINHANRNTSTPQKLMLHLLYWLTFILLHRPFVNRKTSKLIYSSDKDIDHVKLCKRASDNIMDLLHTWQTLYGLRYVPVTLFQAAFSAGTVYLILAAQAASGPRVAKSALMTSLSQVKLCIEYLREVGKSWQSATNIAEILSHLFQLKLKPILDKTGIPEIDLARGSSPPRLESDRSVDTSRVGGSSPSATSSPHKSSSSLSPSSVHISPQSQSTMLPPFESALASSSGSSSRYSSPQWQSQSSYTDPNTISTQFTAFDQPSEIPANFNNNAPDMEMGFMPPLFNLNYDSEYLQQQLGPAMQADLELFERIWDQSSQNADLDAFVK